MDDKFYFVGVGSKGVKIAKQLSKIYSTYKNEIFYKKGNSLQIHSLTNSKTVLPDVEDELVVLAGSVNDHYWQEARKALSERKPCLLLTMCIDLKGKTESSNMPTFANECLIFPEPLITKSSDIAQLVMQLMITHLPWYICKVGSLIGYDIADTKGVFAGRVTAIKKMTSNKKHYRQNFSKFLDENKSALSKSQGVLMSLWGEDKYLPIVTANEMMAEMEKQIILPDANLLFTYHVLPKDCHRFMAIIWMTLESDDSH